MVIEFKDLFQILHNRISDGMNTPDFMRELISMITEVPEEEWGTDKDPSGQKLSDETLRNYSKRGFTKKFAKKILLRLKPEIFIDRIESLEEEVQNLLVEDYKKYDSNANKDNIGQLLANQYVEIIKAKANTAAAKKNDNQTALIQSRKLKEEYGEYLLNEVNNSCPYPGCGKSLMISQNGKINYVYEVCLIRKNKRPEVNNLLALCPQCAAAYSVKANGKLTKQLEDNKKILSNRVQNVELLDNINLEKGIVGVLKKIKDIKETEVYDSSYDPKKVSQKIDRKQNWILYNTVINYVNSYYSTINQIMMQEDKCGNIDFEELQHQMHSLYKRLNKQNKSKEEIFNEIAKKLSKVSLMDQIYCEIVVAYFIQLCEVYDEIPK